jgi:probable HAF family extracellular repeat protein
MEGQLEVATDINEYFQIVGTAGGHAALMLYGRVLDLGTLAGRYSGANAINDLGQIVGWSYYTPVSGSEEPYHATLWSHGRMTDLGTLGGQWSEATSINNLGQIVGLAYLSQNQVYHAFIYEGGTMRDMGVPGELSYAYDINNYGQAVGFHIMPDGTNRAFLYERGATRDLSPDACSAISINDRGNILGTRCSTLKPFLYHEGTLFTLSDLFEGGDTWNQIVPLAINNRGEIVGYVRRDPSAQARAVVLKPVHDCIKH